MGCMQITLFRENFIAFSVFIRNYLENKKLNIKSGRDSGKMVE